MESCPNCNKKFTGNYCSNCGQKLQKGRFTIKMILADFVNAVFLFDSTLYTTFKELIIKPGNMINNFLAGRRVKYLPPFQFFLLFMTIYLIILGVLGDNYFHFINEGLNSNTAVINKMEFIQDLIRKNLNVLYFLLTPVIAFYIHLLYRKTNKNFAEKLLFAIYMMGMVFFFSSVIILLGQVYEPLYGLKILVIAVYFPAAIMQFTNQETPGGFFKAVFTMICSYVTFAIIIAAIVLVYTLFFTNLVLAPGN